MVLNKKESVAFLKNQDPQILIIPYKIDTMSQKTENFLAFDIGATSGRSILGTIADGKLTMRELTRFPNKTIRVNQQYFWDIYALFDELKRGLKVAAAEHIHIDAIGIDTWGVDFVFLGADGSILGQPRSYRDPYTIGAPEGYFEIVPKQKVYELTGIQIMNFNSLFQLFAAKRANSSVLDAATDMLFIPDALSYMFTGNKICEYTIASTSQMLNPHTGAFEHSLLEAIGVSPSLLQPIVMPGTVMGYISESVMQECGVDRIPVIAVAGHDTASAVASVPASDGNFAYLSSGTWSLMGIETEEPIINETSYSENFTNEGGVDGTVRFLKNITGMWLLEQCRKEWEVIGHSYDYAEIVKMSESAAPFRSLIDPDDSSFACPERMTEAIANYCRKTDQPVPESDAEYIRCIFDSLSLKYRAVLDKLRALASFPIERLHVIGGGSKNALLNQMTANAIGIPVVAGPGEATAIGNIMLQAKAMGLVSTLTEMRNVISNSVAPETFYPKDAEIWEKAYTRFTSYLKQ